MSELTNAEMRRQEACFLIQRDRINAITDLSLVQAEDAYDRLLVHLEFDCHEPELADALRYGLEKVGNQYYPIEHPLKNTYVIKYPGGES